MSITKELREFAKGLFNTRETVIAIADRIDAEHERQLEVLYRDMSDAEYIKLPVDMDGEPIHVGDVMDSRVDYLFDGKPFTVRALVLCEDGWEVADGRFGNRYEPDSLRHHHASTVEDVLREFAEKWLDTDRCTKFEDAVVAEYAKKLRLAGDE